MQTIDFDLKCINLLQLKSFFKSGSFFSEALSTFVAITLLTMYDTLGKQQITRPILTEHNTCALWFVMIGIVQANGLYKDIHTRAAHGRKTNSTSI